MPETAQEIQSTTGAFDIDRALNTPNEQKKLQQLEATQAYFDQITQADGWSYTDGIKVEDFQGGLDARITVQLNTEITRAVRDFNIHSSSPLETLTRKLDSYLAKDRLGSRKGEETKEFILQTLQEKAEQESEPAKLILLRRIIAKFSKRNIS